MHKTEAVIVADEALPPGPGKLKGMAFFAETPEGGRMASSDLSGIERTHQLTKKLNSFL
jgi:hypothetical protein